MVRDEILARTHAGSNGGRDVKQEESCRQQGIALGSCRGRLNWPDDYQSWEKLAAHCDSIDQLSDLEKEQAKRSFTFLRGELGEDFLVRAYSEGHPLAANIGNLAPWTRRWVAHFADSLRELQTAENYSRLLTLLKSKERAAEALLTTKFAAMLSKAGFGVTIDPPITVQGVEKVPDLRLIDAASGEELYVEVSASHVSVVERDAHEMGWLLLRPLMGVPILRYTARFYKSLSRPHLISLVWQIAELAYRVRQDGAFRELVIEDVLELGVAPEHDVEMLNRWGAPRGLSAGTIEGPPYNVDEVHRTQQKVKREQRQLPPDRPNVLIIESLRLFLRSRDIVKIVSELEETVYEYPHLLAVVISGSITGRARTDVKTKGQHVFVQRAAFGLVQEYYLLLLNRFCELKVSPSVISSLYGAFRPT